MPCQNVSATMALYDAFTQRNIFGNTPIEIILDLIIVKVQLVLILW